MKNMANKLMMMTCSIVW